MPHLPEHSDDCRSNCGHCGNCKWWQSDKDVVGSHEPIGLCLHEELAHFQLQVSADSGCNRFRPAEVDTAEYAIAPGP